MKKCTRCNVEKPLTNFYSNGKTPAGTIKYKGKCRPCEMAYSKERYYKIIEEHYGALSCSSCGYNKCREALEFHHLDPLEKEGTISNMKNYSKQKLVDELNKCVLLCANCHRETHFL